VEKELGRLHVRVTGLRHQCDRVAPAAASFGIAVSAKVVVILAQDSSLGVDQFYKYRCDQLPGEGEIIDVVRSSEAA
jgi:hypothetical protein